MTEEEREKLKKIRESEIDASLVKLKIFCQKKICLKIKKIFAKIVDDLDEQHKISGGCLAVGMIGMQFFIWKKIFMQVNSQKELCQKILLCCGEFFIDLIHYEQNRRQNLFFQ